MSSEASFANYPHGESPEIMPTEPWAHPLAMPPPPRFMPRHVQVFSPKFASSFTGSKTDKL